MPDLKQTSRFTRPWLSLLEEKLEEGLTEVAKKAFVEGFCEAHYYSSIVGPVVFKNQFADIVRKTAEARFERSKNIIYRKAI